MLTGTVDSYDFEAPGSQILLGGSYAGGELIIEVPDHQSQTNAVSAGMIADVRVAVDARLSGATGSRWLSVQCRRQETSGNFYRFMVSPSTQQYLLHVLVNSGAGGQVFAQGTSTSIRTGEQVNRLEIICVGDSIVAIVNGVLIANVSDSTFTTGRIAVGIQANVAGLAGEARFDNLEIQQ